jgi:hypothetical protein
MRWIGFVLYALLIVALVDWIGVADVSWPWEAETKTNPPGVHPDKDAVQPEPLAVPAAPSYISVAMASDGTGIDVSWRDNSDNETGFDISNGVKRLQVGPNQTSLSSDWGGLSPGQRMCFRVSAYNTTGSSGPTAWDCITMPKEENSTAKSPEVSKTETPPEKKPSNRNPSSAGSLNMLLGNMLLDNFNRAQIQQILEYKKTGTYSSWKAGGKTMGIKITRTDTSGSAPCREFIALLEEPRGKSGKAKKGATACRDINGVWKW